MAVRVEENLATLTTMRNVQAYNGQVYTPDHLSDYDVTIAFNSRFLWGYSRRKLLQFYNKNISGNHLEVGVATGYYLDKCRFPVQNPQITLLDVNANSLEWTSSRIQRYRPKTKLASVLEPISLESNRFDSIGINYVLQCLPGTLAEKAMVAFKNLKPLMKEGAIIFGSTILGDGVKHNFLGRIVMNTYNGLGAFDNWEDKASDLEDALEANFSSYSVKVVGCTVLFTARK